MLFLKDETLRGLAQNGNKMEFTVFGRWSGGDIISGVAATISLEKTGKPDASVMLDMLWEAENMVIDRYGQSVKLPKLEAEIEKAKSVAEKKADLAKRESNHKQWRAFVLGWTLSFFCSALLRVIFG
jgi:hypothetical protein